MTTKGMLNRMEIDRAGYGSYKVTIIYGRHEYCSISHNTEAYDRIFHSDAPDRAKADGGYTLKEAVQAMFYEVVRKNR